MRTGTRARRTDAHAEAKLSSKLFCAWRSRPRDPASTRRCKSTQYLRVASHVGSRERWPEVVVCTVLSGGGGGNGDGCAVVVFVGNGGQRICCPTHSVHSCSTSASPSAICVLKAPSYTSWYFWLSVATRLSTSDSAAPSGARNTAAYMAARFSKKSRPVTSMRVL